MGPVLAALIPAAASLFGGLFAGKKSKKAATQAAGGARLQDLMPQIMQMMQQQQGINQQNYQGQVNQQQANMPLQDAVRRMAMNLTPNHLQPGLSSRVR